MFDLELSQVSAAVDLSFVTRLEVGLYLRDLFPQ